jgi:filamentous hemagglutinin
MKIRQSLAALPLTPMVALAPKHGDEFPEYQNSKQNVQGAQDFVNNSPAGTLIKTRPNGDTLYYDPPSDTFAVKTKDGSPRTMFKPDPSQHGYPTNLDYFNAQK